MLAILCYSIHMLYPYRLGSDNSVHMAVTLANQIQDLCRPSTVTLVVERGGDRGERGGDIVGNEGPRSLDALIDKVKQLEGELAGKGNVPEKQLYLLSDLRSRVVEVERVMSDNLTHQRSLWESERVTLSRAVQGSKEQIEELKHSQEGAVHALRTRYQGMLDQAQSALETQTGAARGQIDRLEELLRRSQLQVQISRLNPVDEDSLDLFGKQRGRSEERKDSSSGGGVRDSGDRGKGDRVDTPQTADNLKTPHTQSTRSASSQQPQSHTSSSSSSSPSAAQMEEMITMRRLVHQTKDELDTARKCVKEIEARNVLEVEEMIKEYSLQSEAHDCTVRELEKKNQELQDEIFALNNTNRADPGPYQEFDQHEIFLKTANRVEDENRTSLSESLRQAEEQINRIEERYELKCEEMEELLR